MKTMRGADALLSAAVLASLLGAWWAVSHRAWVSPVFLPTPEATVQALAEGLLHGDLWAFTLATAGRMAAGWGLAALAGMLLGAWIGSSAAARTWLQPTLEFLRPLPASAVVPPAVAVFGLSSGMLLFVVAFGAMWPVLLATVQGFASLHPRLNEVADALQMPRRDRILKLGLPHALPDILAGLRLSLTVSLIVSVVGEMIASQDGLGQAILLAARSFRASELFAGVLLLGAIGFGSNTLLARAEARWLRWQNP
ncbi:MAG: ABC transporter permease [Rubrivivax sp.]|nr:ABC transporter permease [Rubrivivax sp.]